MTIIHDSITDNTPITLIVQQYLHLLKAIQLNGDLKNDIQNICNGYRVFQGVLDCSFELKKINKIEQRAYKLLANNTLKDKIGQIKLQHGLVEPSKSSRIETYKARLHELWAVKIKRDPKLKVAFGIQKIAMQNNKMLNELIKNPCKIAFKSYMEGYLIAMEYFHPDDDKVLCELKKQLIDTSSKKDIINSILY